VVVRFVDIGGIVEHHVLSFLFIFGYLLSVPNESDSRNALCGKI